MPLHLFKWHIKSHTLIERTITADNHLGILQTASLIHFGDFRAKLNEIETVLFGKNVNCAMRHFLFGAGHQKAKEERTIKSVAEHLESIFLACESACNKGFSNDFSV